MKKVFEEPVVNVVEINDIVTNDNDTSFGDGGGFAD
jgi:hypothetical protein